MKRQVVKVKSILILLMISALLMTVGYSLTHVSDNAEQTPSQMSVSHQTQ